MKCTSCQKNVADDAAVCPFCDAVLDPSLLDMAPPEGDDDDAPPPPPKKVAPKKPIAGSKPGVKKPMTRTAAPVKKKTAPPPDEDDAPAPAANKNDWRSQISEADWKENQGKGPEKFQADKAIDPEAAMGETKNYLMALPFADKLALGGASGLLITTFLPWKETVADGIVLGVFSSGIVVTILASLAVAGIIVRTRKTMPTMNPLMPWVAQLGCVGISALWCLVYIVSSWDSTKAMSTVGNYEVWVSEPNWFCMILAIGAAIVSLVGTILGLKDVGR